MGQYLYPGCQGPGSLRPPQLDAVRLHGTNSSILGLIDLIGMSSPLHNVVIRFTCAPNFTVPDLSSTMERILVVYYDH